MQDEDVQLSCISRQAGDCAPLYASAHTHLLARLEEEEVKEEEQP